MKNIESGNKASLTTQTVGVVAIGRNEGQRLGRCIQSVIGQSALVIYVDSGSTDDSVSLASRAGAVVVELDMSEPFTAARARNEGFRRLRSLAPRASYVQFVDGDCEVVGGWIEKATAFLEGEPHIAVVCGRRRERFPTRSIYNQLCDHEWDTPVGETKACGGDALIRSDVFEKHGGYRHELIAGEEPELCLRLRTGGWLIWRLDLEMTLHDADITKFGQWWRRNVRNGYAFAEGAFLHGKTPECHWVWESRRAMLWGLMLPLVCLAAIFLSGLPGLLVGLIYVAQIFRQISRNSGSLKKRAIFSFFQVLTRFPEALGQVKFRYHRAARTRSQLIEYK
jgi:glycosyltransferase involved in cell wall biosynthesis